MNARTLKTKVLKWKSSQWKNSLEKDKIEFKEMAALDKQRFWKQVREFEEERRPLMSMAI